MFNGALQLWQVTVSRLGFVCGTRRYRSNTLHTTGKDICTALTHQVVEERQTAAELDELLHPALARARGVRVPGVHLELHLVPEHTAALCDRQLFGVFRCVRHLGAI